MRPSYPSARELITAAEKEVKEVSDLYNSTSFTRLEHDHRMYGPLKHGQRATAYKAGEPDYRDQTLWESLAWNFGLRCPEPDMSTLQDLMKQGISYSVSELRAQLADTLQYVSANRPQELREARAVIEKVLSNLAVARRCAEVLGSGAQVAFSHNRPPNYYAMGATPTLEGSLWDISNQTLAKRKPNREDFKQWFERTQQYSRVVRVPQSTAKGNIMGYVLVNKTKVVGNEGVYNHVTIIDAGAYKMILPENAIAPDVADSLTANVLRHYFSSMTQTDEKGRLDVPLLTLKDHLREDPSGKA